LVRRIEMTTEDRIKTLILKVCDLNWEETVRGLDGQTEFLEILQGPGNQKAKTRRLYRPLMTSLSYQGIGDLIVYNYLEEHGEISYHQISRRLGQARKDHSLCQRLQGFETFKACGYQKTQPSCNNLPDLPGCPVPSHDLLKGVLNVKAYSFYFYIRDVCQGDILGRLDQLISQHYNPLDGSGLQEARKALVQDLTRVFGIGDKLANMTLSGLLMSDPNNQRWVRVGQAMVAVDSLVHNFLHRTGILRFYQREHPYGPRCSRDCLEVLDHLIREVDARKYNPSFPKFYPRFVQFSIWRFCSVVAMDICNGVKIRDSEPCQRNDICPVFDLCDHIALRPKGKEAEDGTSDPGPA
jgi:hypothetical protein